MTEDIFDWGPLGRDWWMENSEAVHATTTQAKFACARHMGCTRTKAAELAGYAGDGQALRTAGSRADDTKAVQDLLTMASAATVAAGPDDPFTVAQARQKIGRMVKTSLDPTVVIKGTELLSKLDQVERDRGQAPEDDGFLDWRLCRDCLHFGASVWMLLYKASMGGMGHPASYPLLHDVHFLMQNEPLGPKIWDHCVEGLSDDMREHLERRLADKSYQLEARKKIWAEIGKQPPAPIDPSAVDWRVKGNAAQ